MKKTPTPHDRYFRANMAEPAIAKDFFQHHLPEQIKKLVDLETLSLQKESFIDEQLKLGITDILYKVNIQQQTGYIYLLVEHQSNPQRLMPFRILKYLCSIMDHHLNQTESEVLPFILPMVFYHGKSPYPYSIDIFDLFAENKQLAQEYLFKPFHLIDIGLVPDEEIRQHQWSGIMEFIFKHIFQRDFLPFLQQIVGQLRYLELFGKESYIIRTLEYIYRSGNIPDKEGFTTMIEKNFSPEIGEKMMTLQERCWEESKKAAKQAIMEALLRRGFNLEEVKEVIDSV